MGLMRLTLKVHPIAAKAASKAVFKTGVRVVALVDKKKLVVVPAVKIRFPAISAYSTYKRVLPSISKPKRTASKEEAGRTCQVLWKVPPYKDFKDKVIKSS